MKGWVIPPEQNSEFVANMERVLDIYKKPYDKDFPVVCMDESPKQLIEEGKPTLQIKPGQETRVERKPEECSRSKWFRVTPETPRAAAPQMLPASPGFLRRAR